MSGKSGSGAMSSNVGNPQTYDAGDQRTSKKSQKPDELVFEEGKANSHQSNDSKDSRSLANRANAERKAEKDSNADIGKQQDPRQPALSHGNEPSKGAKIDAELQQDDEQYLKQKGK